MEKQIIYTAKVARIDPVMLDKLDIFYGTVMFCDTEHVVMTEQDWKWAVKAGAATIQNENKFTGISKTALADHEG